MATATGPDLDFAREQVEALMDDTCEIRRDAEGAEDDGLDTTSGLLVGPTDDSDLIYSAATTGFDDRELGGRCKVSPGGLIGKRTFEGYQDIGTKLYSGSVPWDAPMPHQGDWLKVLSSRRDPQLVDKLFRVNEVQVSTFLVSRRMLLELRS